MFLYDVWAGVFTELDVLSASVSNILYY